MDTGILEFTAYTRNSMILDKETMLSLKPLQERYRPATMTSVDILPDDRVV